MGERGRHGGARRGVDGVTDTAAGSRTTVGCPQPGAPRSGRNVVRNRDDRGVGAFRVTTVPRQASALRAAELYYLENQTMDAISQSLGCSRATVSRLISEARSAGLVEIIVHRKGRAAATLERVIAERYGVTVTVVAPPPDASDSDRLRHAAAQGATLLRSHLAPDQTLAVF